MTAASLTEKDVRVLVRLLGEVAASPGDHAAKKRQLMDGLCKLIKADAWIWALGSAMTPGEQPTYSTLVHGGIDDDRLVKLLKAVEHPDMAEMAEPFFRELFSKRPHITRTRQQIVPLGVIESRPVWKLWEAADIGPIIMSYRLIDQGAMSCIALYRRHQAPLFGEREAKIAHIVLSEVAWLHLQGWADDRGATVPQLPPRQKIVLNLLVEGMSRKEIASRLGISAHTANDHVKAIYRHFGVNSQAQLARRFFQGNGGDIP